MGIVAFAQVWIALESGVKIEDYCAMVRRLMRVIYMMDSALSRQGRIFWVKLVVNVTSCAGEISDMLQNGLNVVDI